MNQIKLYDAFDEEYVNKYYPGIQTVRTVVLYGSNNTKVVELDVGFLLNENGDLILGPNSPSLIKKAIETADEYWTTFETIRKQKLLAN